MAAADDRVREAMDATPRAQFLREQERSRWAHDGPLEIGSGQTNSQPRTVRAMLDLLGVREGDRVLDVGCGSGWTTAILARLTGTAGSVLGVERVPEVLEFGRANLAATGLANARVRLADPTRLGAPDDAPFDRILVSAEPAHLPQELVDQLAPGGVMVIPVAGTMLRVETPRLAGARSESVQPVVTRHGEYRFVPLIAE
ncbi:protein-L-isoaspartate O-methyltransferase family protein [Mariniluteicoccus flavus]